MTEKIPSRTMVTRIVMCFKLLDFETSNSKSEVSKSNSWEINYFLFEKYVTSEGAISHNVLYYQTLPITRITKKGFLIIISLGTYQQCPTAFKQTRAG